jgi:ABC-type uncharacterized transport system substrate-binding protein
LSSANRIAQRRDRLAGIAAGIYGLFGGWHYGLHSAAVHAMLRAPMSLQALMSPRLTRLIVAAFAGLMAAGGPALSHPHVWVTMKSTVVYAPDGSITGVRHAWTFDDMFSTFAVQGLESKQKGVFSRAELAPLAEVNVSSLKEYDYFTFAKADSKKIPFVDPVDYYLDYKDSVLTLHFLLPLKTPVKAHSLDLEVYDPSYFVDFALAKENPVVLSGAPAACKVTTGKPEEPTREILDKLAQIPADQQVESNSYGAIFSNKIAVRCR